MSRVFIETDKKTIKRHLVTDREEIVRTRELADIIQAKLDDPKIVREHGKCQVLHVLTEEQDNELVLQAQEAEGGFLGNVAKGNQNDVMLEILNSKTGKAFMDV